MAASTTIDKQINSYLEKLNSRQKKAVLTVVKTFVEDKDENVEWGDLSFVQELDRRTKEFETGKAKTFTLDEMEASIRLKHNSK